MNEQPLPDDLVDQLIDGTAPSDQVPADLRSVSELLQSAHGPATAAELSGMAAMVQQFTATVLDPTVTPATTTSRRPRMFATRITRRAAAVVAVTLMAAGTAAAAAGGALPEVFSSDDPSIAAETSLVDTTDVSDTDDASETTDVDVTDDSILDSLGPDAAGEAAHGLCESYVRGVNDDRGSDSRNDQADDNPSATNPPTLNLDQAAADAGVTVDDYCTAVLAAHEAEAEDEADDDSTESTIDDDDADEDEDDDNSGSGNRPTLTTPDRSGSSGNSGSNSGRGGNSGSDDSETESAG